MTEAQLPEGWRRKALSLIEAKGWATRQAVNRHGCLCVGGAISMAICGDANGMYGTVNGEPMPDVTEGLRQFADFVGMPDDTEQSHRVWCWNDSFGRGEIEVVGKLRLFAELDAT